MKNYFLMALLSAITITTAQAEITPKTQICMGCHGEKGKTNNPTYPHLAGQNEAYLIDQLKQFRDGRRTNAIMAPMATALTDADIKDIAKYYSQL